MKQKNVVHIPVIWLSPFVPAGHSFIVEIKRQRRLIFKQLSLMMRMKDFMKKLLMLNREL